MTGTGSETVHSICSVKQKPIIDVRASYQFSSVSVVVTEWRLRNWFRDVGRYPSAVLRR
jgi:hypothetical protein